MSELPDHPFDWVMGLALIVVAVSGVVLYAVIR